VNLPEASEPGLAAILTKLGAKLEANMDAKIAKLSVSAHSPTAAVRVIVQWVAHPGAGSVLQGAYSAGTHGHRNILCPAC
jgi:hypothetical protein